MALISLRDQTRILLPEEFIFIYKSVDQPSAGDITTFHDALADWANTSNLDTSNILWWDTTTVSGLTTTTTTQGQTTTTSTTTQTLPSNDRLKPEISPRWRAWYHNGSEVRPLPRRQHDDCKKPRGNQSNRSQRQYRHHRFWLRSPYEE